MHGKDSMEELRTKEPLEQAQLNRILKEVGNNVTDKMNTAILTHNGSYRKSANIRRDTVLETKENSKPSVIKHERFTFDRDSVRREIEDVTSSGGKIVWMELARRFTVKRPDGEVAKNANEVLKRFAISEGLYEASEQPRIRRGKRKIQIEGLEIDLSAMFPTDQALKAKTREKIASGALKIGDPIAPITLRCKKIDDRGQIKTHTVTMYGRALTLQHVMDSTLKQHSKEGFLRRLYPTDYTISTALTELAAKGKHRFITLLIGVYDKSNE